MEFNDPIFNKAKIVYEELSSEEKYKLLLINVLHGTEPVVRKDIEGLIERRYPLNKLNIEFLIEYITASSSVFY